MVFSFSALGELLYTTKEIMLIEGKLRVLGERLPRATVTAVAHTTSGTFPGNSGLDPTIVVALIAFAGVVVGAVIAGLFAVYQSRRTAKLEQENREQQFKHEQEMERIRHELDQQYKRKERVARSTRRTPSANINAASSWATLARAKRPCSNT